MKLQKRIAATLRGWMSLYRRRGEKLTVAVVSDGGVGDCLMNLNYARALKEFAGDIDIDFFCRCKAVHALIPEGCDYVRKVYDKDEATPMKKCYDLTIWMRERFPLIRCVRTGRLKEAMSPLLDLIEPYRLHHERFSYFYDHSPRTDGFAANLSLVMGFTRVTQADIGHLLGIDDIRVAVPVRNETETLVKFGLKPGSFITVNRSADSARAVSESTKLWTEDETAELIRLLSDRYPDKSIVFIGPKEAHWVPACAVNLAGKTDFEELKVLLKHAYLHVGPEGGMIHLRHTLGGRPSAVLFGPTSAAFYGYSENLSIEPGGCIPHCEWLTPDWQEKCLRNGTGRCEKLCRLTAETVIYRIDSYLKRDVSKA